MQVNSEEAKDMLNKKRECNNLKDLEFLKTQKIPGPFTKSEEVTNFMSMEKDEGLKNNRMYIEGRYLKNMCTRMKSSAPEFRLRLGGKKLQADKLADNIHSYLDQARNVTTLTIGDLRNVLNGISCTQDAAPELREEHDVEDITVGEHVAAVWEDDNDGSLKWHLGVVETLCEDSSYKISYLNPTGVDSLWVYPEEAHVCETKKEQLIAKKLVVSYSLSRRIRCTLDAKTLKGISFISKRSNNCVQNEYFYWFNYFNLTYLFSSGIMAFH